MRKNGSNGVVQCDYLIVGAGPAGLQLGYFLQKAGRDYLILEGGGSPGRFFSRFPRHRTLISINKVYTGFDDSEINLRWDWNSLLSDSEELLIKNYTKSYFPDADTLVRYLTDFAHHWQLKIKYRAKVVGISKEENFKVVDEEGNQYTSERVIVATGMSKPYIPAIDGIELADRYVDVTIDSEEFANKRVLIIGKGNSGFETAENIIGKAASIHIASPHPIRMAWSSHYVGHLRAVNNNLLDTYQLKSQNAVIDASIEKIEKKEEEYVVSVSYTHANGEKEELRYDRVIVATGFKLDETIFEESCRPALAMGGKLPEQTSEWESSNVKGLYFAGTLMQQRDYKKTTSGFIHGFRYNIRALHRMMEQKYQGEGWAKEEVVATAAGIVEAVIRRVNRSSALWQQFGFLCDVIVVGGQSPYAQYYEEMPTAYLHDIALGQHPHYYTVSLEYGPEHAFDDPFNVVRVERNDVENANMSNFLHPIIRRFSGPKLISEHHVIEDLAARWMEDVHIEPLLRYFSRQLSSVFDGPLIPFGDTLESSDEFNKQSPETIANLN
jgi:thioredoxin reductase